ncbi:MAG TPA: hypothetical protein VGF95_10380 [Solirubrobacteraceae bacterium]
MDLVMRIFAVALLAPVALVIAVALGPVVLGIICAGLFGLIIFALWSFLLTLGVVGRRVLRKAGSQQRPRTQTLED